MIIEKTTIPYETFKKIPVRYSSEYFRDEVRTIFEKGSNNGVIHLWKNDDSYPPNYSWYALSLWAKDIRHVQPSLLFIPGITFNKWDILNAQFILEHHDFLKRWVETVDETIERIHDFKLQWWLSYIVQSHAWEIIWTMSVKQSWVFAAVFSFMVVPKYRKKWLWKLMVGNVHEDLVGRWVQSIRAKTKNKYVYHLLKRLYKWEVLRKEIYT